MEERDRKVHVLQKEADLKRESSEEWGMVGGLLATQAMVMSWAWITARGHVWVHGLAVAAGSVLMSLAPMATEGQEDGTTQSWACPH